MTTQKDIALSADMLDSIYRQMNEAHARGQFRRVRAEIAAAEELRNPTHAGRRNHMLGHAKRGPDNGSEERMFGYDDFA